VPVSRAITTYQCRSCGARSPKWVGRCPACHGWDCVEAGQPAADRPGARPVTEVDATAAQTRPTGVGELDRVLGGGLVPGSVVLLAGEPGVGKSTLLLSAAANWAADVGRCLLVTAEESAAQVRLRAERIGALHPNLFIVAETDLDAVLAQVAAVRPSMLVVDSVQTVVSHDAEGAAGGVTQVRAVAAAFSGAARAGGIATVLVGHVTKDGSVAGPRVLEHLVDVVLHFEGERHSRLRLVTAAKNRFGPAEEVGCFDLRDDGIDSVPDPSGLFLSGRGEPTAGTCVTVVTEGRRALVTEVQALVAGAGGPVPRRACTGVDPSRVAMVLAVLDRRGGKPLGGRDVYVATVGGARAAEPAVDLAVALAVAGSAEEQALPAGWVAIGEVGLAGELRPTPGLSRRLAEAARLGFRTALVPADPDPQHDSTAADITVCRARTLREALAWLTPIGHPVAPPIARTVTAS
jgi:DNA repair protein RadA/Sms